MSGYPFKKADRLRKRKEFLRVSRDGKRISDRHFILRYVLNDDDRPRLGIIISKKVGNAVMRNRIKRIVREFYRYNRHRLGIPLDLVVIAQKPAAGLTSQQAVKSLGALFDQLPDNAND